MFLNDSPDNEIDTSDIPEVTDWGGAVRGAFTKAVTIRISAGDLLMAGKLAHATGMPYRTCLKSVLPQALIAGAQRAQDEVNGKSSRKRS